jgi:NAD(P)-dependent dehydrogenase (short-subunit alcohol dehydrogenase family)
VIITGCDTGFGKELVLRLAAEGFVVFAGCFQEDSQQQFPTTIDDESLKIHPMVLDVTKDDHVQDAYKAVQKWLDGGAINEKRYLHAVVNNAGAGKLGYIDWMEMSDFEFCMNGEC